MDYPWYTKLENNNNIEQGDLIPNCPIVIPPSTYKEGEEIELNMQLLNAVILSQSCDLVRDRRKLDNVLVCPYYTLAEWVAQLHPNEQTGKARAKQIENLRKGHLPAYHLLDKDSTDEIDIKDYQVVDFRNVYSIHYDALMAIVEKMNNRIRLLPPYREHLSQAFARYFMRVGLPQDIIIEGY